MTGVNVLQLEVRYFKEEPGSVLVAPIGISYHFFNGVKPS